MMRKKWRLKFLSTDSIAKWLPSRLISLGTDGFGRSDGRRELREFFEVDAKQIVFASLAAFAQERQLDLKTVERAIKELEIDPDKAAPHDS